MVENVPGGSSVYLPLFVRTMWEQGADSEGRLPCLLLEKYHSGQFVVFFLYRSRVNGVSVFMISSDKGGRGF